MGTGPTRWQVICATTNPATWLDLLRDLNEIILGDEELIGNLPYELAELSWFGASGVTAAAIEITEKRIGAQLPPSYQTFLAETDGWQCLDSFQVRLLPAAEIGWLRDLDPEMVKIWGDVPKSPPMPDEDYLVYEGEQPRCRVEHIADMLVISDQGWFNSKYVWLDPRVISATGEWEAWSFSSGDGECTRYRSFHDLMLDNLRMRLHDRDFPV